MTRATVIVPTFKDQDSLILCLNALNNQSIPRTEYEVIVANNDPENALTLDPKFAARVVDESLPGSYAARNRGIVNSTNPIIAFTDADCIPSPTWLANGLAHFAENPEAHGVAGRIEVFTRAPSPRSPTEIFESIHGFPQERYVAEQHFGATANLFVKRSVFDEIGMFEPLLRSGGDVEFGNRMWNADLRLDFVPSILVRHPARITLSNFLRKTHRTMAGTRDLAELRGDSFPYPLKSSFRNLLPPLRSVWKALTLTELPSVVERIKYAAAVLCFHYGRNYFKFRLGINRASPR